MTVHVDYPARRVLQVDVELADRFTDTWAEADLVGLIGPQLSCSETEDLASVLTVFGAPGTAEGWLKSHARSDEDGDLHTDLREAGLDAFGPREEEGA
ncbi:hypothetical protein AB0I72_19085 [Nocardiopsis sp. NPDC049922]|uniref:hypothetical protein n=1 Tax=Nocardiopsis sp. NPDC049922 TaxID=3155157 RepID=UPI003407D6CE